jgi:hypothetical protein
MIFDESGYPLGLDKTDQYLTSWIAKKLRDRCKYKRTKSKITEPVE